MPDARWSRARRYPKPQTVRSKRKMHHPSMTLAVLGFVLVLALIGCNSDSESGNGSESGEHSSDSESENGEGGEESGTQFAFGDTFDEVRAGARLVLSYDSATNAFTGTVENTTRATLSRVRVEVHLSNGIELGPTTPVDLAPGQVVAITLPASSQPFTSWSAHPGSADSWSANTAWTLPPCKDTKEAAAVKVAVRFGGRPAGKCSGNLE